ncbi:hypothetical protein JCM9492_11910 [Aquifex pyrophilus]
MNRKNLIRINLNKEAGLLERIKTLNLSEIKESVVANILPILFLSGVVLLLLTAGYYFILNNTLNNLKAELQREKAKRERLTLLVKRLEAEKRRLERKKKLFTFVKRYNESFKTALDRKNSLREGILLQNLSLCAFREQNCDVSKMRGFTIKKPILQVDFIALREDESIYELGLVKKQELITVAGYPYKRFCIELIEKEGKAP